MKRSSTMMIFCNLIFINLFMHIYSPCYLKVEHSYLVLCVRLFWGELRTQLSLILQRKIFILHKALNKSCRVEVFYLGSGKHLDFDYCKVFYLIKYAFNGFQLILNNHGWCSHFADIANRHFTLYPLWFNLVTYNWESQITMNRQGSQTMACRGHLSSLLGVFASASCPG